MGKYFLIAKQESEKECVMCCNKDLGNQLGIPRCQLGGWLEDLPWIQSNVLKINKNIFTWRRIFDLSQYQVFWLKSIVELDIEQTQSTTNLELQNNIYTVMIFNIYSKYLKTNPIFFPWWKLLQRSPQLAH